MYNFVNLKCAYWTQVALERKMPQMSKGPFSSQCSLWLISLLSLAPREALRAVGQNKAVMCLLAKHISDGEVQP